jgi:hypothetical protein
LDQPILRGFDLHPDGERVAMVVPSNSFEAKLDKVTFIFSFSFSFNFFDELRRLAPAGKK